MEVNFWPKHSKTNNISFSNTWIIRKKADNDSQPVNWHKKVWISSAKELILYLLYFYVKLFIDFTFLCSFGSLKIALVAWDVGICYDFVKWLGFCGNLEVKQVDLRESSTMQNLGERDEISKIWHFVFEINLLPIFYRDFQNFLFKNI